LCARLPERSVEYNAGDVPVTLDPKQTPRTGLSAEETIRRIAECRSWLVLKNVEQDPAYGAVLEACLAEVHGTAPHLTQGMSDKEAFVFVSSPRSVTPFHIDPEENFLLQIRGRKTLSVFDPADRSVLSEEALENFHSGAHRNQRFDEAQQARAGRITLTPGIGVHIPLTAPHWVQNDDEVSVSFSITFQTRSSMRRSHAHRMNGALRRLGLRPAPVGQSSARDALKQFAFRVHSALDPSERFTRLPQGS
jgi:hypothetical protein